MTCWNTFREEFHLRNLLYRYHNKRAFYSCQWRWNHLVFVIIRLLLAGYAIFAMVYEVVLYFSDVDYRRSVRDNNERLLANVTKKNSSVSEEELGKNISGYVDLDDLDDRYSSDMPPYAFFTVWSFSLLTVHLTLAAILSIVFYRQARDGGSIDIGDSNMAMKTMSLYPRLEMDTGPIDDTAATTQTVHHNRAYDNGGETQTGRIMAFEDRTSFTSTTFGTTLEDDDSGKLPWYLVLSWALSNIVLPVAVAVTCGFWGLIFPQREVQTFQFGTFNVHAMNSLLALIDHAVSARPVRILHIYIIHVYGIGYVVFNYFYWRMDREKHVTYPGVLEWRDFQTAIINSVVLVFVVLSLSHLLFFYLYQLKRWIYRRVYT